MTNASKTPQNWASKFLQLIGWGWQGPGVQPQDFCRGGGNSRQNHNHCPKARKTIPEGIAEVCFCGQVLLFALTEKRSVLPVKQNFCSTEHFVMSAYKSLSRLCTTRAETFGGWSWTRRKEWWGRGRRGLGRCFSLKYFIPLLRMNTRLSCL